MVRGQGESVPGSDLLRQVFEAVVRACMDAGLVKGEGFAVDASVMEADASRYHGKAPDEMDWSAPERQTRAEMAKTKSPTPIARSRKSFRLRTRAQRGPPRPISACSSAIVSIT